METPLDIAETLKDDGITVLGEQVQNTNSHPNSHLLTAEKRLFKALRKKHKIDKPFTEEERIREISDCLNKGANINGIDKSDKIKNTILHIAVQRGYTNTVQFLLEKGADKNIKNADNKTPLDIAVKQNNIEIITLLGGQVQNTNSDKGQKGDEDGKSYEKSLISLLSAKGFENAECNTFGVGREVKAGKNFKFGDVVFMYPGQNDTKNLILVQSKHKERYCKINSEILSSPASSKSGNANKNKFNLEKYFISYLKTKEYLKNNKSGNLKNGKIKYCVLFTNAVLDIEDLEKNGFRLKTAPADIISLLNALESENYCRQFVELSDELQKKLEEHSESFGKSNQEDDTALPTDDVTDFLNHLIFIDNQPHAEEFKKYVDNTVQNITLRKSLLSPVFEEFESFGPDIRNRLEKILKIDKKANEKERWISKEEIVKIIEEKAHVIGVLGLITVITIIYENEIMKWGLFKLGQIKETLDDFFRYKEKKVLRINTPETALSSIKMLQYFSEKEGYRAEDGRISVNLNDLTNKGYQNIVVEAFKLKDRNLLTIQCTETNQIQGVEEFYNELHNIVKDKHEKRIILVIQKDKPNILSDKFVTTGEYSISEIDDEINVKDFEPKTDFDPLKQKVILFAGQRTKISLSELIRNNDWNSYLDELSKYKDGECIIDASSLVQVLNGKEIIIGSEPQRISSLEGAYAKLFEEINKETFRDKLFEDVSDDLFIISGINGSDKEKIYELIHYLGIGEIESKVRNIKSGYKIQIEDDQFKDEQFVRLCKKYPDRKFFWIIMKNENFVKNENNGKGENHSKNKVKFILHQFYNPDFYINRKFIDKVFITKEVKHQLINLDHSEIFIISGDTNEEKFTKSFEFCDKNEEQQFRNNCTNGKIWLANNELKAESHYQILSKQQGVKMVHWLTFEESRLVWRNSCGSLESLRKYIDEKQRKESLTEENILIKEIKDKKVVIIADDPGMGKSTTLTRLYESRNESESILESHWVIKINLIDHVQAIKDIDSANIDSNIVKKFLSKLDLNHSLAKNLLRIALNKKENSSMMLSKPLLIAFDGFDELLDEEDRNKIISLLKFLKNESGVKFWITTRLQFKQILEDALSTFAIEFHPIDEEKTQFITKYLKDRMSLILSKGSFEEVFGNNNKPGETTKITKYTNAFLIKMESVFQGSACNFLGTPLQLYLMLEGSVKYFKNWIENYDYQPLNFDYLGKDILEVYEKFIQRKYEIYFNKTDVKEQLLQRQDKMNFDRYYENLAISIILNSEHKKSFEEFKDIILSTGIVKSQGSIYEFIHPTFREYFAAQLFIHWIEKTPNVLLNSSKQEYLLREIFMKPSYKLIRMFMNIKLKEKIEAGEIPEKKLTLYGEIINKLWGQNPKDKRIEEGTILHIATTEDNKQIANFIFNCLEKVDNSQERIADFLSIKRSTGDSAFCLATFHGSDEIFKLMLYKIDKHFDENQFHSFLSDNKICTVINEYIFPTIIIKERILELLVLSESKLSNENLCEFFGQTDLHRAVIRNDEDKVKTIVTGDAVKEYLFSKDNYGKTVLHHSVAGNKCKFTEQILEKAKEISSEEELKLFLCERDLEGNTVFDIAVEKLNFEITNLLLKATKCLYNSTNECKFLTDLNDNSQTEESKTSLLKSLLPEEEEHYQWGYFKYYSKFNYVHTYLSHLYSRKELLTRYGLDENHCDENDDESDDESDDDLDESS